MGPWCHACGQRDYDVRAAIWELLGDALSETFEVDGRAPRTLAPFFTKPGLLVEAFVAGKRQRYTGPIRLFLFCLAASFLAFQLAGARGLANADASLDAAPVEILTPSEARGAGPRSGITLSLDDADRASFPGLAKLEGRTQREAAEILLDGFLDASPIAVIAFVPLFALLLELLYPRYLVIEHLLLSMNLTSVGLVLFAVAALVDVAIADPIALAVLTWHLVAAQRRIYRQRWWQLLWKSVALWGGGLILFLVMAMLASLLMLYWL